MRSLKRRPADDKARTRLSAIIYMQAESDVPRACRAWLSRVRRGLVCGEPSHERNTSPRRRLQTPRSSFCTSTRPWRVKRQNRDSKETRRIAASSGGRRVGNVEPTQSAMRERRFSCQSCSFFYDNYRRRCSVRSVFKEERSPVALHRDSWYKRGGGGGGMEMKQSRDGDRVRKKERKRDSPFGFQVYINYWTAASVNAKRVCVLSRLGKLL